MLWGGGAWLRARREARAARDLVGEAETVLSGRTLDRFLARGERVPAWTLVSTLGHGSRRDLVRMATTVSGPDPHPHSWSGIMARLAGELFRASRDEPTLVRLQRRSLIPLELALLDGRVAPPTTPAALYEMISGSLELPLHPEP